MMNSIAVLVLGVLVVSFVGAQQPQPQPQGQAGQCMNLFLQNLKKCVEAENLNYQAFLQLIANGNKSEVTGSKPENENAFETEECKKEMPIVRCGFEFMNEIFNASTCVALPNERMRVAGLFRDVITLYDNWCAHPCRRTFYTELSNCYTKSNLAPELFLSNATMGRGAILGTTEKQASLFCENKDSLISCMKNTSQSCPESFLLLRRIGLNILSMERGVNILCKQHNVKVYLDGLKCFAMPTSIVRGCQQTLNNKTLQLLIRQAREHLEEKEFFQSFCDNRMEHISCDLNGWEKKEGEFCNDATIGLRTELECGLIPDQCSSSHKTVIDKVCHHDNFKKDKRAGDGGASLSSTMAVLPAAVLVGILSSRRNLF